MTRVSTQSAEISDVAVFTRIRLGILIGVLIGLSIPAFFAPHVGSEMAAMVDEIDASDPYLTRLNPILLYVVMPVCVLGVAVLLMSPGLLGVLLLGRGQKLEEWLLEGFVISLVLVSLVAGVTQSLIDAPLTGTSFSVTVLGTTFVLGAMLLGRACWGGRVVSPISGMRSIVILGSMILVAGCFVIGLTPKFFWESFNGDGAHAYESARLLLYQGLPFWPAEAGAVASWPGMNGMLVNYPTSWFVRLFGETEAAARLPLVLYIPLLFAAVVSLAREKQDRRLSWSAITLIWMGIVSFQLVMSYSATYNPYSADIAMPAVMDSLVMICYFGAVGAFIRRDGLWLILWAVLALMTSPGNLVLFAFTLLGLFAVIRPRPYRLVFLYGAALVGCLIGISLMSLGISAIGLPSPGTEHSPLSMLARFADIALMDFERFGYVVLACGIYPVVSLFTWHRANEMSRVLIVTSGALFAMYYLMGSVSLHYFVPVMLIPIAVFWRIHGGELGRTPLFACYMAAGLSIWLALPATESIYTGARTVGEHIRTVGFDGYRTMSAPDVFAASESLTSLFPTDAHPDVPDHAFGESPLALLFYSMHRNPATVFSYELVSPDASRPPNATEVHRDEKSAVFVYDVDQWKSHSTLTPATSRGKAVFAVSRNVLFYRGARSSRFGFFSPGRWLMEKLNYDDSK